MVDALRRARDWVTPGGCVIDVHPKATPAGLEVNDQPLGPLDGGDAPERHARASTAVATAVDLGLFAVTSTVDFVFNTYGESIEELRDHIATHWRSTRIGPDLFTRARSLLDANPSRGRPRVVEEIILTRLRAGASP